MGTDATSDPAGFHVAFVSSTPTPATKSPPPLIFFFVPKLVLLILGELHRDGVRSVYLII